MSFFNSADLLFNSQGLEFNLQKRRENSFSLSFLNTLPLSRLSIAQTSLTLPSLLHRFSINKYEEGKNFFSFFIRRDSFFIILFSPSKIWRVRENLTSHFAICGIFCNFAGVNWLHPPISTNDYDTTTSRCLTQHNEKRRMGRRRRPG